MSLPPGDVATSPGIKVPAGETPIYTMISRSSSDLKGWKGATMELELTTASSAKIGQLYTPYLKQKDNHLILSFPFFTR